MQTMDMSLSCLFLLLSGTEFFQLISPCGHWYWRNAQHNPLGSKSPEKPRELGWSSFDKLREADLWPC